MKVVSPPRTSADPLLRLVRRALMEEAQAELIKARLEKRRVARMGRRKRRGRDLQSAEPAILPATKKRISKREP